MRLGRSNRSRSHSPRAVLTTANHILSLTGVSYEPTIKSVNWPFDSKTMTHDHLTAQQLLDSKASKEIVTTRVDTTVKEACKLMRAHRLGCLIVTNGAGQIEGIFTERDVVNRLVAEDKDASDTKVGELMTRDVIVVEPERNLSEVEAIMKQNRIRHMPVAGSDRLLGLLSIGDVLASHAATSQQMVHHLTEYIYGRH